MSPPLVPIVSLCVDGVFVDRKGPEYEGCHVSYWDAEGEIIDALSQALILKSEDDDRVVTLVVDFVAEGSI